MTERISFWQIQMMVAACSWVSLFRLDFGSYEWFHMNPTHSPWSWRQYAPPKRRNKPNTLHGMRTQNSKVVWTINSI